MSQKKTLITLLTSFFVLIAIIGLVIVLFVINAKPVDEKNYTLSDSEEIVITLKDEDISYFTTLDFLNKDIDSLSDKLRNVMIVDTNSITLKNITLYEMLGDLVLTTDNNKVIGSSFNSTELNSPDDAINVLTKINKEFSKANKTTESKIYIVKGNNQIEEYSNANDLYDANAYAFAEYKLSNAKILIRSNSTDGIYTINMTITAN